MAFTLVLGRFKCDELEPHDALDVAACGLVRGAALAWRNRMPGDLQAIPLEAAEPVDVDDRSAVMVTRRQPLSGGHSLVVVQTFVSTWSRPTVVSREAFGRLFVDGFIVRSDGQVEDLPEHLTSQLGAPTRVLGALLVVVVVGMFLLAEFASYVVPGLWRFLKWPQFMAYGLAAGAGIWFFPQVWENRRDDKVVILFVGAMIIGMLLMMWDTLVNWP